MGERLKIKVQPLTKESFAPYGQVVATRTTGYLEFEPVENQGKMAIQIIEQKRSPVEVDEFATHFAYTQPVAAVTGTLLVVVAPPPERIPNISDAPIDYDRMAAFAVKPGQVAIIGRGTWHYLGALEDKSLMLHVTRRDPAREFQDTFANFVNTRKRDGRVIEVLA